VGKRVLVIGGLGLLAVAVIALIRGGPRQQGVAREIERALWTPGPRETFRTEMVDALPEPARRYLLHAIRPGTLLANAVRLTIRGEVLLKRGADPMPMDGVETLSLRGYVWRARLSGTLAWIRGHDAYFKGRATLEWLLWGRLALVRASDAATARSAAGRLALEAVVWLPSVLLTAPGVTWEATGPDAVRVTLPVDRWRFAVDLTVDQDGRLLQVAGLRWGNHTDDGKYADIPFGAEILEEGTFGGYTVPTRLVAGWWFGTDKFDRFFRPVVEDAEYL